MTKKQREHIYWAAMFEIVAAGQNNIPMRVAFERAEGTPFGWWLSYPELQKSVIETEIIPRNATRLLRLSKAIDLCQQ